MLKLKTEAVQRRQFKPLDRLIRRRADWQKFSRLTWIMLGLGFVLLWRSPAIATDIPTSPATYARQSEVMQQGQPQTRPRSAPEISVNYQYYLIKGKSVNDLYEQMQAHSPLRSTQNWFGFAALTNWQIDWKSSYVNSAQGCTVQSPSVKVTVSTTLPRWQSSKSVKTDVKNEWQRYLEALSTHESGHQHNGIRAARAVQQLLLTSPSASSCPALADKMNKAVQDVVAEYRRKDRTYDRLTQHGSTQGAILNRTVG
jgi:predicted secreted Zn-dependent protease